MEMSRLELLRAMRLEVDAAGKWPCVALVGSGGKTTAMFQLARQSTRQKGGALLTTTTHLGLEQVSLADRHMIVKSAAELEVALTTHRPGEVSLFSGPPLEGDDRLGGLPEEMVLRLAEAAGETGALLLVEADGARQRPLKAPAAHEPALPACAELVLVCTGLSGLGRPLNEDSVHRAEIFARLAELKVGERVTPDALAHVLTHEQGGLKGLQPGMRRVLLLNQADHPETEALARQLAEAVQPVFPCVVVAALEQGGVRQVWEPHAGIVLAAGAAQRFGRAKQIMEFEGQPLVRRLTRLALAAGLSPVRIVIGAYAAEVRQALAGLPVEVVENPAWAQGQSTSVKAGLRGLPEEVGGALFLLADQPFVSLDVIRALVQAHAGTLSPIIAPRVGDRRANPVLFDRVTFSDLLRLQGDMGGRALIASGHYRVNWLDWLDEWLLEDIDTPEDFARLTGGKP